jgi:hypothetical protein
MAKRETQKVKGCRKCGRQKRKEAGRGSALSLFVRGKIAASDYFKMTNQATKKVV